ncbi:unnamed protein product [Pleuronectes platessa]|uniref:Uncharacterized protein n=1 Tax=Pleuronectes platessa TaxID=8262 RepID=A0A9N7V3Q3_PLEPL|nr:unnamed protein product [Pleuronectes platessa]
MLSRRTRRRVGEGDKSCEEGEDGMDGVNHGYKEEGGWREDDALRGPRRRVRARERARARRRVRPVTGTEKTDYLQWTSRWVLRLGDGGASQAIGILSLIPLSQRRTSSGGSSHSRPAASLICPPTARCFPINMHPSPARTEPAHSQASDDICSPPPSLSPSLLSSLSILLSPFVPASPLPA